MKINEIDVLITTRNRINDLCFTIDHCLSIGFGQDQIWIVDDNSTDGTYEYISNQKYIFNGRNF